MDRSDRLERGVRILNGSFVKNRNPAVSTLSGEIVCFDCIDVERLCMKFRIPGRFSSADGSTASYGVGAAVMDAVCANAVVLFSDFEFTVATLEQQCCFLSCLPVDVDLYAFATITKRDGRIAFLNVDLRLGSATGTLVATGSQCNSLLKLPARRSKM
uniref:Thioesterase domain-containing protein n=1 Tax=Mucochytrium quahogii TaxID=96639 RepID=A0A7S2WF61_9STRA|mmetsp:Transcript_15599/g.25535  ORF Transcript_15599/g.25535 Transcript_15599/m.25535 type:complete len:158 (-) Transcript_15599:502-975(-)